MSEQECRDKMKEAYLKGDMVEFEKLVRELWRFL